MSQKAVVLLSGGLDSATVLAIAQQQGYECYALSLSYGQRHVSELQAAANVAAEQGAVQHKVVRVDLGDIGGSALTDSDIAVPESPTEGIPITYVPARNTIMLSVALGWAEVLDAKAVFAGMNAVDYSGYPDCRPNYLAAFQTMANLATKAGIEGHGPEFIAPLMNLTKAQIIKKGAELNVDYSLTVSCYQADEHGNACDVCDSCRIRKAGFAEAKVSDPTQYKKLCV